ncbi:MAG: NUDIX hydrolase [Candidatus Omnitrophica bacterium]|nr:NUDIX hydrolase [Candidatus Omnitrophota bacterium]
MARRKIEFQRNHKVKLPNGHTISISVINHPGAVVITPFLNDNTLVMIRQFRPALKKYIYELPAGTLDPGESAITCAGRELLEETGLKARRLVKLGDIYPVPGYSTEIIQIFKALDLTATSPQPEDYEIIQILPMTRGEVRQMFKQGKLMDAKSICALAFCGWL